jgi:hypothetical protein
MINVRNVTDEVCTDVPGCTVVCSHVFVCHSFVSDLTGFALLLH